MQNDRKSFVPLAILNRNFEEVKPPLSPAEAMDESNRCLYCYDAPCIQACPTSINIPSFIKKIASGNILGSATTIMDANPIGASCARVCPTEELCEGACVLNHSTKPIMIGDLQRYATDWAIKNEQLLFKPGEKNGMSVGIIGGGPAGLSAARELARLGYAVTIYEAKSHAGGLNAYGIVSFRLPQKVAQWEVEQVEKLGVQIKTNINVGQDISVNEILETYDSVILAVGMSKGSMLQIEGEELKGVHDAIQFVEDSKTKEITDALVGKRVVVIGAGNTAIDAATCSVRLGAENVKILYRRSQKEMTAYEFEYEFAKQDNVEFRWLTAPTRLIGDESGQIKQLECIKMQLGEPGKDGRCRPIPVEGSEFMIEVDAVIKAIGQTRYQDLIEAFELEQQKGSVKVNLETFQTSNPKVYAVGDVIFGEGQGEAMVVSAAQHGKKAAYAIHQQLKKTTSETV